MMFRAVSGGDGHYADFKLLVRYKIFDPILFITPPPKNCTCSKHPRFPKTYILKFFLEQIVADKSSSEDESTSKKSSGETKFAQNSRANSNLQEEAR
jgi:hypothetical protein